MIALRPRRADPLLLAAGVAFVIVLVRTAWICDDAYITFRTIDNFVNGHGMRWNPIERVQEFTDPLWMLVLSGLYAAWRNAYAVMMTVSFLCTAAAVFLLVRSVAASAASAACAVLALTLSRAFMDYSTSGLENPLTHLLIAAFFVVYWRTDDVSAGSRRLLSLSLLAALTALNRLDVILLVGPALVAAAWPHRRTALGPLVVGLLPLIAWLVFATVYFGTPLPNTAFAKLGGAIDPSERAEQGMYYLLDSLNLDPLTLFVIGCALAASARPLSRDRIPPAIGMVLMLIYVVRSGGDFMSGRQLAAPFFVAVLLLARGGWQVARRQLPIVAAAVIVLALAPAEPGFLTPSSWHHPGDDRDGIVDERRVYFPYTGLVNVLRGQDPLKHPWAMDARRAMVAGEQVVIRGANGFFGYVAGPRLDIIDSYALTDALLSHLPAEPGWWPGHLRRRVPEGYLETRPGAENVIREPGVAAFFDHVRTVTEGPLFTRERLLTIWRLNTGAYDALLDGTSYGVRRISERDLSIRPPDGSVPGRVPAIGVHEGGVEVKLDRPTPAHRVELSLDGDDEYVVSMMAGGHERSRRMVSRAWPPGESRFHTTDIELPPTMGSFDALRIRARYTWGPAYLGYVKVLP